MPEYIKIQNQPEQQAEAPESRISEDAKMLYIAVASLLLALTVSFLP